MNRVILPLDNKPWDESLDIMRQTQGRVWGWKIRRQIFEKGLDFLTIAKKYGRVMVDFKFADIPSAIAEAVELFNMADIITLKCDTLFNPYDYQLDTYAPKLAGVTVLTTMTIQDVELVYNGAGMREQIQKFASIAEHYDYGYLVCSAADIAFLENTGIKKICPGIRPKWYQDENDDQQRTMTPADAIKAGAEYLVIGRPILKAENMIEALNLTNEEIRGEIL